MPFDLDDNKATYQIRAFSPGTIQINEKKYHHSLIVTPDALIDDWKPQELKELKAEDLKIIIELKPDVLLLGTGAKHIFLSPEIYGELINARIGVEVMDTGAACRTYNALTAENRRVVAALIIR